MYIGLCFIFQIFNFWGPLVYQFYYCYMLPSLNKVLLTYLLVQEAYWREKAKTRARVTSRAEKERAPARQGQGNSYLPSPNTPQTRAILFLVQVRSMQIMKTETLCIRTFLKPCIRTLVWFIYLFCLVAFLNINQVHFKLSTFPIQDCTKSLNSQELAPSLIDVHSTFRPPLVLFKKPGNTNRD